MSKLVAVVIRKLPQHRPVTSAIIQESTNPDIDDMVHYLKSRANDHVRQFTSQFVEFKRAGWFVDVVNLETGETISTDQIAVSLLK